MTIIIVIYVILLGIFVFMSALVVRHPIKYGYLSPRFKTVLGIFGFLAVVVILLSLYFLVRLAYSPNSTESLSVPGVSNEFNF